MLLSMYHQNLRIAENSKTQIQMIKDTYTLDPLQAWTQQAHARHQ